MGSAAVAAVGLVALSQSTGAMILVAATLYGFGKTFFWPTMLGVVAEQFPKGGALTLNATGGVGMLGVGVVGAVFLGYIQDTSVSSKLLDTRPELAKQVLVEKQTVFGQIEAPDPEKKGLLPETQQQEITQIEATAKKEALFTVAIFPVIMFVCYLLLFLYFRSRGGYQQVHLEVERTNDMLGAPVGTVEH
jgi:hypothetical protein